MTRQTSLEAQGPCTVRRAESNDTCPGSWLRGHSPLWGKGSPFRNALAGIFATGVDYLTFATLFYLLGLRAPLATLCGCLIGGTANFWTNLYWSFNSQLPAIQSAPRYIAVSTGSALLNSALVALFVAHLPSATGAWLLSRGLVFMAYNHPLHRHFVFKHISS